MNDLNYKQYEDFKRGLGNIIADRVYSIVRGTDGSAANNPYLTVLLGFRDALNDTNQGSLTKGTDGLNGATIPIADIKQVFSASFAQALVDIETRGDARPAFDAENFWQQHILPAFSPQIAPRTPQ